MARNTPNRGPEQNDQQQAPEVKFLTDMVEVQDELRRLRDDASGDQEKNKDALRARIQKTVDGMLKDVTDPVQKQAKATEIATDLKSMDVEATARNGAIMIVEVGLTAEAMLDSDGNEVASESIAQLDAVDISPASRADIRKAIASMDITQVEAMAGKAEALIADVGPEGVQMMIDFFKADPTAKAALTEQFKDSAVGLKVQSLVKDPLYEQFFKSMEGGVVDTGIEGDLSAVGVQISEVFNGKGFESLMKMIGEIMLFINDLKAQMSNGELPRLTDKGIDDDIDKGRHIKKHKTDTMTQWRATRLRLDGLGVSADYSAGDDSKGKIGELRARLAVLHGQAKPDENGKEMDDIAETIKSLKKDRTELIERKKKLEERLYAIDETNPEKELKDQEAKERNDAAKSIVDGVNNIPMNDFATATDGADKGVRIAPKGTDFDPALLTKLEGVSGAVKDGKDIVIAEPNVTNAAAVVQIIKEVSAGNIEESKTLAPHEKKGLKGAIEASGKWFGPVQLNDQAYDYIQASDGTVYAQNTKGTDTWVYKDGDFQKMEGQHFNGKTGKVEQRPASLDRHKYNPEDHTFDQMDEVQIASKKEKIKTAGEQVLNSPGITKEGDIYKLDAKGSAQYNFRFNEINGEWEWQFDSEKASWHDVETTVPVDRDAEESDTTRIGYPYSNWSTWGAGVNNDGLNEAKSAIVGLKEAQAKASE